MSGSVAYNFTPLLSGLITGGYRANKFTGEGGGQAGRNDKIISGSANISYQIFRWLSATSTTPIRTPRRPIPWRAMSKTGSAPR